MTIKKLAAILGLSHSTVSRALNGHPAISQSTKDSVMQAAREYGYIPNNAARALRNASSGAFGLIIPDIQNDFFIAVTNAIAREAADSDWQMILAITGDRPESELNALRRMMAASVDGIIIAPSASPLAETEALITRTRAIQLLRQHPRIKAPLIAIDERCGIQLAVQHLLQLGHTRIGYIGSSSELSTGHERLQGFMQHLDADGQAALRESIYTGPPQVAFGVEAFTRMMDNPEPPTALVLGSPRYAMDILLAAKARGVRIGEDLSLVAYGDVPWGGLLDMTLTRVILPAQEITDACVARIRQIMGGEEPEEGNTIFTPRLAIGTSTRTLASA